MKHLILMIILCATLNLGFAHKAINEREERGLRGKVKLLTETSDYGSIDTYEFDSEGILIKAVFNSGEPIAYEYKKVSDKKGKITAIEETDAYGNTNSTETFNYDKQGVLTSSHFQNASLSSNYIHYWDKDGLRTKVERLFDDGSLEEYYSYDYDKQGYLTRITSIYVDGSLIDTQEFTNDQYGNPLTITSRDADGELLDVMEISYEYDDQGNFVKQTTTAGLEEKHSYVLTREIEYYR